MFINDLVTFSFLIAIGAVLGKFLEILFRIFWKKHKINQFLERNDMPTEIIGMRVDHLIGTIIKFSVFLVFVAEGLKILDLVEVYKVVTSVLNFIPNLLRIFIIVYAGEFILKKVEVSTRRLPYGQLIHSFVSVVIFLFIAGIVLTEIGISEAGLLLRIVEVFVWGIAGGIAITIGAVGYNYIKQYLK